jgi:hypothetical protein
MSQDAEPDPADLLAEMAAAVEAEDYERAARLRDELERLGAPPPPGSRIRRQTPGRMGIGTDRQAYAPPEGWVAPKRPPPLTSRVKPRRG